MIFLPPEMKTAASKNHPHLRPVPALTPPFDGEWKVVSGRRGEHGFCFEAVWPPPCGVPVFSPGTGRVAGIIPVHESGADAKGAVGPERVRETVAVLIELAPGLRVRLFPFRQGDLVVAVGEAVRAGSLLGHLRSVPRPRLVVWMEEESDARRWRAVPFRLGGYRTHPRRNDRDRAPLPSWRYHEEGTPTVGDLLAGCGRTPWMEGCFRPRFPSHSPVYSVHTSEGTWRESLDLSRREGGDFLWQSRLSPARFWFRLRHGCFQPLRFEGGEEASAPAPSGPSSLLALFWHAGTLPLHPLQGMTWCAPRPHLLRETAEGGGAFRRFLPALRGWEETGPRADDRAVPSGEIVFADAASQTFKMRRFFAARPDFLLEMTFSASHGLVEGLLKTATSWQHVQRVK